MTVSGISSVIPSSLTDPATFKQGQAAFQALAGALQAGDLGGAQKAFADFIQIVQGSKTGQLSADLQAVGSALQSGDIGAAQKAFATLQQNAQKAHGHHRHHHRLHIAVPSDSTASATAGASSSPGSVINVQA